MLTEEYENSYMTGPMLSSIVYVVDEAIITSLAPLLHQLSLMSVVTQVKNQNRPINSALSALETKRLFRKDSTLIVVIARRNFAACKFFSTV